MQDLIERLKEHAEWEVPICLGKDLREVAEYIRQKEMIEADNRK